MTRRSRGASASGADEGRMRVVLTDQDKPDEVPHFKCRAPSQFIVFHYSSLSNKIVNRRLGSSE